MSTPVTAVAFHESAPLAGFEWLLKRFGEQAGSCRYMDCIKVETTDFGMLRLVPTEDSGTSLALYVHPSYIIWMLRADDRKSLGFV